MVCQSVDRLITHCGATIDLTIATITFCLTRLQQSKPTEQATCCNRFFRGVMTPTHACKARPLTTVGREVKEMSCPLQDVMLAKQAQATHDHLARNVRALEDRRNAEHIVNALKRYTGTGPVPMSQHVTLAPAVTYGSRAPVIEPMASVPAVTDTAPVPVSEHVTPAPTVTYGSRAPVIEPMASVPAVTDTAPVPVSEHVTPAPAVTYGSRAPVIGLMAAVPAVTDTAPAPVNENVAASDMETASQEVSDLLARGLGEGDPEFDAAWARLIELGARQMAKKKAKRKKR